MRRDGYLASLSGTDIRLYLFLVLAANSNGVSWWGDRSICGQLKIRESELRMARGRLVEKSLIAYRRPYYQVLSLQARKEQPGSQGASHIGHIITTLTNHRR